MGAYIKENWLFVVVAVYLVSMVLYGHYRGFVRLAVSAVSLVLSLGVVHFGAPSVANLLRSNEVVYQAVEDSVTPLSGKQPDQYYKFFSAVCSRVRRTACSVRIAQCGLPAADHIGTEPSGRCRAGGCGRDLFRLDCSTAYYTVLGNGDW